MAARLFSLRAELAVGTWPRRRARLSGLWIGSELALPAPIGWASSGHLGADDLSQAYATALAAQGVSATIADSTAMTLAGLRAAYVRLKEPVS